MKLTIVILYLISSLSLMLAAASGPAGYPVPKDDEWIVRDFRFHNGEMLPELRLHYTTIGAPSGEPVLILHGTGGSSKTFLSDSFAGALFGPGQPLDAARYFIILPDDIGHGQSSKPSDGLRAHFPAYAFDDMVRAQYQLVAEHLGIRHLRLIIGGSIGGMHAWMWAEKYPAFMDAVMPLQCLPVEVGGMNRMLRRVVIDSIRNDPEWRNGNYAKQPIRGLTSAQYGSLALFGSPTLLYKMAPTRAQADANFDQRIAQGIAATDANDMLYQFESSRDYNPEADLSKIQARVIAINTADDSVNPPELGVMEQEIVKVPHGRYVLIPRAEDTIGHGSYRVAKLFKQYVTELLTTP